MNLKTLRETKGFQRKFAVSKIGISGKHLNDIEAGRVNLTDNCAEKISQFYGVNIDDIKNMYEEGKNETSGGCKKTSPTS
jgi:DNA-binding XRE family transcriptional regulator